MLLEDQLEPAARAIADFLAQTGGGAGSSWDNYTLHEDLLPLRRTSDTEVEFIRPTNNQARFKLFNIHEIEPDVSSIKVHPTIILASEPVAETELVIDNLRNSRASEPVTWSKIIKTGENELNAIKAGWENETWGKAEAKVSAGPAEASVEAGFRNKLSAEWSRQTGRSHEETSGGVFPLVAGPHSLVRGQLVWNRQTRQNRVECDARYSFGIEMGRRSQHKRRGWSWRSGSPVRWDDIEHLLAIMEHRGSVHHARYEHYSRREIHPNYIKRLKATRLRHIDRLTPAFEGADGFRVVINELRLEADAT